MNRHGVANGQALVVISDSRLSETRETRATARSRSAETLRAARRLAKRDQRRENEIAPGTDRSTKEGKTRRRRRARRERHGTRRGRRRRRLREITRERAEGERRRARTGRGMGAGERRRERRRLRASDVDETLLSGGHVTRPRRIEINAFASRIPASSLVPLLSPLPLLLPQ